MSVPSFILPYLIVILLPLPLAAQFSGGTGNLADPYQIATAADLNNIRSHTGSVFIQTADIDLGVSPYTDGAGWLPIPAFSGHYNGNGFKIRNLTINRYGAGTAGLFSTTTSLAQLRNIGLVDVLVAGGDYTGSLVGWNQGSIQTSFATGQVTGAGTVGGLVGYHGANTISDTYTIVEVSGGSSNYRGGFAGYIASPLVRVYASGTVSGSNRGGLVGLSDHSASASYWNTTTSGLGYSDGGVGLTSAQMKSQASYSGWDFANVWEMKPGADSPILRANAQSPYPGYVEQLPLTIAAFTPTTTHINGNITISGTGFDPDPASNQVWFGGVQGTVTEASPTQLTVMVPIGAGYGPITVTTNGQHVASKHSFGATFTAGNTVDVNSYRIGPSFTRTNIDEAYRDRRGGHLVDLDGDGKPDLFHVVSGASGGISIFRNIHESGSITSASFAARQDILTGSYPHSAQVADLDADGKPDLVVYNTQSYTITVLRNTSTPGTISFESQTLATGYANVGDKSKKAAIGDVDGDGLMDILMAGYIQSPHGYWLSVYRNTSTPGTMTFAAEQRFGMEYSTRTLTAADFDGDGKADVAFTYMGSTLPTQLMVVKRSTSTPGAIGFAAAQTYVTSSNYPYEIAAGDLNGDGLPEVAVSVSSFSRLNVFPNTSTPGTISFGTRQDHASREAGSNDDIRFSDVDGDGKAELIYTASAGSGPFLMVYPNTSTGGSVSLGPKVEFANQWESSVYQIYGMGVGDADLDGKSDMVLMSYSNLAFFENRVGTARFSPPASSNVGYGFESNEVEFDWVLSNSGTLPLTISSATSGNPALQIYPTSAVIAAGASQTFTLTYFNETPGQYASELTFSHNAPNRISNVEVTFDILETPPPPPVLSAATAITNSSFTIQWEEVLGADHYLVEVFTSAGIDHLVQEGYEHGPHSGSGVVVNGLADGATYYYRVVVVDELGNYSQPSALGSVQLLAYFAGGDGSEDTPYLVATAEHLNNVRLFRNAHYRQTQPIGIGSWTPLGTSGSPFTGTYDGQHHAITGMTITVANYWELQYAGLFGVITGAGAVVRNVVLKGAQVSGADMAGAFAGRMTNGARIVDSHAEVVVMGGSNGGGFVGELQGATISGSYAAVTVSPSPNYPGNGRHGGLAGTMNTGLIENSYTYGTVAGQSLVGGLVGFVNSGSITHSYSVATVTGSSMYGGLVGYAYSDPTTNSYWSTVSSGAGGMGIGLTNPQLRQPATFTGWDFDSIWNSGTSGTPTFPFLRAIPQDPPLGVSTTPTPVVLAAPADGATKQLLSPTFSWSAEALSSTYELQVATDAAFTTLVHHVQDIGTLSHTPGTPLETGTTYYWRVRGMNETVEGTGDWSATRTFGTYVRNLPVPGYALAFDGVNDYVSIPELTSLAGNAITIEYWFKGSNMQSAVRQQAIGEYISSGWSGAQKVHILSNDGGVNNGVPVGSAEDGTWHHVAMTWQRNTTNGFKSYLDGVLVAQRTSSDNPLPEMNDPVLLGSMEGLFEFINGRLDEVRIWNVARTGQQIRESMHRVVEAPETGLLLNLSFRDGAGNSTDEGVGLLHEFDHTATSGWVTSTVPVGGSTTQSVAVQTGTLSAESVVLTLTDGFDQPVDMAVTRFPISPNVLPTVDNALEEAYWIVQPFGTPGTFAYTLEFTVPESYLQGGAVHPAQLQLFHRDARADGAWTLLKDGASALTETSVAFTGISVSGQFAIGTRPLVTGIEADASTLAFGTLMKNQARTSVITLENIGDVEVVIGSIGTSAAAFTVTPASVSIPAGGSAQVAVTFHPTGVQAYTADLTLTHDAEGSPLVIPLSGSSAPTDPGNAFSFVETEGFHYLEIPDATHPTQYTIEAWVRPNAVGPMSIISRTNALGPDLNFSHSLRINAAGKFEHYTYADAPGTAIGTTSITIGRWYHVAGVFSADKEVILYVNGVQEGNIPVLTSTLWNGGTRYLVGFNQASGTYKKFTGHVDELRIWHTTRTEEQIRNASTQVLSGNEAGLVGNWRFDEASGNALNMVDATRTGVVFGNPVRVASTAPVQAPVLATDPATIAFGYYDPASDERELEVQNTGSHPLTIALAAEVPHFSVAPAELTVDPGQSGIFTVTFEPVANAAYADNLVFTHNAGVTPISIPVTGTGLFAPTVAASAVQVKAVGSTSAVIKWTPGNGSGRIVYVTSGSHTPPSDKTTHALGLPVVYNGSGAGDSVVVEGLAAVTEYTVRIYEYNGPDGSQLYNRVSVATATFTTASYVAPDPGTALVLSGGHALAAASNLNAVVGFGAGDTKSITLWIRPDGAGTADGGVFNGKGIIGDVGGYWGIYQTVLNGEDRIWVYNYDSAPDVVGIPYTPGEWMHVGMVHMGGMLYAYKNGILVGSVASGRTFTGSQPIAIGRGYTAATFQGALDDVAIWRGGLTSTDMQRTMYQPPQGNEGNLAGYWPMDEGNGLQLYDKTPNARTYTVSGSAAYTTAIPPVGAFIHGSQNAWYLLSNPNPETTLAEFLAPLWTQGATGSDSPNNGGSNVFELDETTGTYRAVTDLTVEATPGKGWLVWVYKNDVHGVEGAFPKRLQVPRPASPTEAAIATSHTPASLFSGFNLVGNPYPKAIDWGHAGWVWSGVTPSVYVYDQTINNYRTWNRNLGTGTNSGSRYIAPLQGFLVETTTSEAQLRIPVAAVAPTPVGLLKPPDPAQDPLPTLTLSLAIPGREEQTAFVFHRSADGADIMQPTRQLEPMSADRFMIYSVQDNGDKVDVAELPRELAGYVEIPVYVEASDAGALEIGIADAGTLDDTWDIVLYDRRTDTYTDLRKTDTYRFTHEDGLAKARPDSVLSAPVLKSSAAVVDARFTLLVGIGVPTDTPEPDARHFALVQNYPNPFNPSTVIGYRLSVAGHTRLTVYDVLGREIAVLVNGMVEAGTHRVTFDASALASGVYLYRLESGGRVLTRSMVLMR